MGSSKVYENTMVMRYIEVQHIGHAKHNNRGYGIAPRYMQINGYIWIQLDLSICVTLWHRHNSTS